MVIPHEVKLKTVLRNLALRLHLLHRSKPVYAATNFAER
jgi:hypothetical protein